MIIISSTIHLVLKFHFIILEYSILITVVVVVAAVVIFSNVQMSIIIDVIITLFLFILLLQDFTTYNWNFLNMDKTTG